MRRKKNRGWIFIKLHFAFEIVHLIKQIVQTSLKNKIQMRYPFQVILFDCVTIF